MPSFKFAGAIYGATRSIAAAEKLESNVIHLEGISVRDF